MKKLYPSLFFFFLIFTSFAQQHIEGLILNEKGEPLGFAHAYNQTMEIGHVSNMSGRFRLLAQRGDTVRFSYVGYNQKEVILESEHLNNYLKVTLTEDSLLLPSITIYSDPYFKVPFSYQGESMKIDGIETSTGKPMGPGSISGPSNGGIGLTLNGPITFFSKDAKEQRKAQTAYEETNETIFFQKFIESDTVKQKICEIYQISDKQFDQIIVSAYQSYPEVQTITKTNDLWYWLLLYFKDRVIKK